MTETLEEYLTRELEDFKKSLNTFDDYLDLHEKISNYKYPDMLWNKDFKEYIKEQWINKQDDHKERVIYLLTELLILLYNDNKTIN